jgi:hypothetical protein
VDKHRVIYQKTQQQKNGSGLSLLHTLAPKLELGVRFNK